MPGADWCKMINGKVETTLQDLDKIMEICDCETLYTNDIYKMQRPMVSMRSFMSSYRDSQDLGSLRVPEQSSSVYFD